ncbi:T3SS effector protein EspS [Escherichia coli DEC8C]|nr:T3SS effector protein EspS [Escherichia coli DEC8C]
MEFTYPGANKSHLQSSNSDVVAAAAISITATEMKTILPDDLTPGKYTKFICLGMVLLVYLFLSAEMNFYHRQILSTALFNIIFMK